MGSRVETGLAEAEIICVCPKKMSHLYSWEKMESDKLPENAFAGGSDGGVDNVFVALACVSGKPTIGKVHNTTRYIGTEDGRERHVTDEDFYVLCMDPEAEFQWVKYSGEEYLPGEELNFRDIGKVRIGRGDLCDDRITDLHISSQKPPTFCGVSDGPMKISKAGNVLTPGLVVSFGNNHVLCAPYDGRIRQLNEFEVLVIKPKETKVKLEFRANSKASKKESVAKFHLEKQEEVQERMGQPGRPALYLTNPEGTEDVILAKPDGSFGQIWHWSQNILLCDTGKALDISQGGVVATLVHGGDSQRFYPFKLTSSMNEKEYLFIGRLSEKDEEGKPTAGEKVFLSVPKIQGMGRPTMKAIDAFYLYDVAAQNPSNTIQQCWHFAYRQIDATEKGFKSEEASPKEVSSAAVKKDISNLITELESLEKKIKDKEEDFQVKMKRLMAEYTSEMNDLRTEVQKKRKELEHELKQFKN